MNNLGTLRKKFDSHQRDILAIIWRYYLKYGSWMPTRPLHAASGSKKIVKPILDKFGGSVVYEQEENGIPYYGLTFLGALLSSDGEHIEEMLADYLRFADALAMKEPNRTHIHSKEVITQLQLDRNKSLELGRFLFLSPFVSSGSFNPNEWNAGLPKDIEDLPNDLNN